MDVGMIRAIIKNLNLGPLIWGLVGFFIGLVVFGWGLTPLNYVDGAPKDLRAIDYQQYYLRGLAHQLVLNEIDETAAIAALGAQDGAWEDVGFAVCDAVDRAAAGSVRTVDGNVQVIVPPSSMSVNRLNRLVQVLGQGNCDQIRAAAGIVPTDAGNEGAEDSDSGINGWFRSLLWLLLIGLLVGAFWWLWNRDANSYEDDSLYPVDPPNNASAAVSGSPTYEAVETLSDSGAVSEGAGEGGITPISTYRTTYTYGQDAYDDSFSIESATGEFLGECGVGISETMGNNGSRAVSALEVWLFDKNDIRTITKVAMSEHIWMDEAIRAKLEPKGEPVMVQPDEVIVLETASLIINARITDLVYGSNPELPENSYFERLSVEMSAWAKNGGSSNDDEPFDFD
ncbi:MAG: hypothetical protein AAF902_10840 [Chloroflexota bacterium]